MDDYDEQQYGGYPSAIYAAAREDNVEELQRLIAQGHVVTLEPEPFGPTVLNSIAKSGDTEIMRMLLDAGGKDFLERFDEVSRTPLAIAAEAERFDMVRVLLAAGADPNANEAARIGNTPLANIIERCSYEMVEMLFNGGADPTIEGWMRLTACDRARIRFSKRQSVDNAKF